ncbi:MAG: signal peptidase II [Anaerolineae bacterium]|nr:signal peptidase II [Anaerolineae bacterium]
MTDEINIERTNEVAGEAAAFSKPKIEVAKDYLFLLALAGSIVLLDQWTKGLVQEKLAFRETWMPLDWLAPYFRIVHWQNTGAAFGMFQSGGMIFMGLAVLVALVILFYFPQVPKHDWALRVAMGMQLAGALGNLLDRIKFGYVVDFISVGNFPVFNVADSSISVGVAVLLIGVWVTERNEKRALSMVEDEDGSL